MRSYFSISGRLAVLLVLASLGHFSLARPGVSAAADDISGLDSTKYGGANKRATPSLNGHVFLPSDIARSPFTNGFIRNSTGVGSAVGQETPLLEIDSVVIVPVRKEVAFVFVDFEYQHQVKDWLGVWGRFNGAGRMGTNVESVLSEGVTALTSFELGWLFKIFRSNRTQLGATIQMTNSSFAGINVLRWLEGVIEDGGLTKENSLVRNAKSLRGGGSLRFAWAPNQLWGFVVTGGAARGEPLDRSGDLEWFFDSGASIGLNLYPKTNVPLGFLIAGGVASPPEGGRDRVRRVESGSFQVAYTGRQDLMVSLETELLRVPISQETLAGTIEDVIQSGTLLINLRYFF